MCSFYYSLYCTGAMDFTPTLVGHGLQRFKETMDKANMWIMQQPPDVNICNVQSIDYKVKNGQRKS